MHKADNYKVNRKLTIQLVPSTCWYSNLRSVLPNWSEVSNYVRQKNKCEICGVTGVPFDAHEVWGYDEIHHIQWLKEIICVCKNCHNVIHFGHAQISGKADEAYEWYKYVNNLSDFEAQTDIDLAFIQWDRRSNYEWKLDEDELVNRVYTLTGINCNIDEPVNGRYYAKVDYDDKDEAKKLGARWDNQRRLWYFNTKEKRDMWYNSLK